MEPPPKQGCERTLFDGGVVKTSLSGTPAEAGVRVRSDARSEATSKVSVEPPPKQGCESDASPHLSSKPVVSVEPPPKQGCEYCRFSFSHPSFLSQWNPRRSRGASPSTDDLDHERYVSVEPPPKQGCEITVVILTREDFRSQWNPRRSRGARKPSVFCVCSQ